MTEKTKSSWETLRAVDVRPYIQKKPGSKFSPEYLPWATVWRLLKDAYPRASHEVIHGKTEQGIDFPYITDGKSAWVACTISLISDAGELLDDVTETLAVFDHRNVSIPLESLSAMDVQKSQQRCLVKCAAKLGLGLDLWLKEDLYASADEDFKIPPATKSEPAPPKEGVAGASPEQVVNINELIKFTETDATKMLAYFKVHTVEELSADQALKALEILSSKLGKE